MAEAIPGRVFIGTPGGGWTDLGEVDAAAIEFEPQLPSVDLAPVRWPSDITLSITVDASQAIRALRRASGALGRLIHQTEHSGSYSHCKACNPEQAPRPLAVDGHEYHRRQRAKQRRRHRGR